MKFGFKSRLQMETNEDMMPSMPETNAVTNGSLNPYEVESSKLDIFMAFKTLIVLDTLSLTSFDVNSLIFRK